MVLEYTFRIANNEYDLKKAINPYDISGSLSGYSKSFVLERRSENENVYVATICGDKCEVAGTNEMHYTFASFRKRCTLTPDKIALREALNYLNNQKYEDF